MNLNELKQVMSLDKSKVNDSFPNLDITLFQALETAAERNPQAVAMSYYGKEYSYSYLLKTAEASARALFSLGIRRGDAVTVMLPNIPQAVSLFYGISRIGAVANMIHTLSSEEEIAYYLKKAKSRVIVTLNVFLEKADNAISHSGLDAAIIYTSASEKLPFMKKMGYKLKNKTEKPKQKGKGWYSLRNLLSDSRHITLAECCYSKDTTAVILYSGGSTGFPKGICLSDKNFNAASVQLANACGIQLKSGVKFLSAMPLFHGFGLCVGLHTFISYGAQCVLVPVFNTSAYVSTLLKYKPHMMAIVPSMLEALLHIDTFDGKDLSFLKGVFCGADVVPIQLQKRVNAFLSSHGCRQMVREGYGLTETVTACIWNPSDHIVPGSVGVPLGDTRCRIVKPGTFEDLLPGEAGELILNGSVVMLGYLDDQEETIAALRTDHDGKKWLFTGDMCRIDNNGYVYFVQRIKRLIITSGFNVTPMQVERIINEDENVDKCCVIGEKDKLLGQRVTAVVVLKKQESFSNARDRILSACKKRLSDYAVPTKIVFREDLPLTKMGKIDITRIENELNQPREGV